MGFKVTTLWAFLSVDPDGEEGVIAGQLRDGMWMPFVASDEARIQQLREHVVSLISKLRANNQTVQLARFDVRTDVEVIK